MSLLAGAASAVPVDASTTPAAPDALRGSFRWVGAQEERSADAEREAFLAKIRRTVEQPYPSEDLDREVAQTFAWVLLGDAGAEFWGGREVQIDLLEKALRDLAAGGRVDLADMLIGYSLLSRIEDDPDLPLDLAWAVAPDLLPSCVRNSRSAYAWVELASGLTARGQLSDAESVTQSAIEALTSCLGDLGAEERLDAALRDQLFESLCLMHSAAFQVQLALGLPDLARQELGRAREAHAALSEEYWPDERAALEADMASDECNLWVLADRHGRRRSSATKGLAALRDEGLVDDAGRVVEERAGQLQFEPKLRAAALRLRWHAALGELLEEREQGRELSPERREWFEGELTSLAKASGWVPEDRLRIYDRLAFEAALRGDVERAREILNAASEQLRASEIEGEFTVTQIGLAALESRILRAEEASREARLEQLERLTAGTESMLQGWDQSELRPGGLGFLDFQARRELLIATLLETEELVGAEAAFELYFEAKRRGSLERRLGLSAPSVAEVRAALCGANGGVLMLLRGQSELLIGVLDASTAKFEALPFDDADGAKVNALRQSLLAPDPARERSLPEAVELSRLLQLDGVAQRLREWNHVYVIGREFVRELPLGALELDGDPLGLTKPVAYLPSAALGVALANQWSAADLGAPQFWLGELDGSSVGLSDASLEAEALADLRGSLPEDARWVPFAGDSVRALIEADLGEASFATLFAHGRLDLGRTRPAGLWIGPAANDTLWAKQAAALRAAQVMILSACGAARTNTRIGDGGIGSLGGAMLEAGARSVVLASADVPRDGTVELTRHLQAHLAAGAPVAEALMLAKRELADSPQFADPYQFANFHVLGIGHLPSPRHAAAPSEGGSGASSPDSEGRASEALKPLALGLLLGAVAAIALWAFRRRGARARAA